ncbi:CsbD family protein [Nocardioides convexus]|uniref:CsbD family protein n=1 Tax=Nocardioides convexus TaxID=2712224 RepID=UPI003101398D
MPGTGQPRPRWARHPTPKGVDQHGSRRQSLKNTAEEKIGEAKEAAGKATDNEDLEAEGKSDQAKGAIKQAGEKVKDVFK